MCYHEYMHLRALHVFKFTKYSHIAEILTLNDVLYWGGDTFISVIMALFVTQYIDGATASSVGIAFMIYRLTAAVSTVQVGKMLDARRGYSDEIWSLFLASVIAGTTYMILSFASQTWHLYLAMFIIGICRSLDANSWRILFYTHIEKHARGRTIGTYDAIFGVTLGAMSALSGFVGELYGFRIVILVAGMLVLLSGFPVLTLRDEKSM